MLAVSSPLGDASQGRRPDAYVLGILHLPGRDGEDPAVVFAEASLYQLPESFGGFGRGRVDPAKRMGREYARAHSRMQQRPNHSRLGRMRMKDGIARASFQHLRDLEIGGQIGGPCRDRSHDG